MLASLLHIGYGLNAWSKIAYTSLSIVYYNSANSANMQPGFYNSRWYGFPVRCQAHWVRSGVANPYNDALRGVGYHDRYWSDAAYSDINTAYFIDVSSLDVTPAHYSVRWNGFSVRCIAS